jgi:heme-degrading monooxygenase HmoA
MVRVYARPIPEGDEAMYARVVTAQVAPGKITEGIQLWRDSVMPAAREQKGFKSGRLLVNRQTGKIISVGLWETEADLQASGEGSAYLQAQLAKFASLFTAPPVIENYEVGAEA